LSSRFAERFVGSRELVESKHLLSITIYLECLYKFGILFWNSHCNTSARVRVPAGDRGRAWIESAECPGLNPFRNQSKRAWLN